MLRRGISAFGFWPFDAGSLLKKTTIHFAAGQMR
jgi:hypothetical protein